MGFLRIRRHLGERTFGCLHDFSCAFESSWLGRFERNVRASANVLYEMQCGGRFASYGILVSSLCWLLGDVFFALMAGRGLAYRYLAEIYPRNALTRPKINLGEISICWGMVWVWESFQCLYLCCLKRIERSPSDKVAKTRSGTKNLFVAL